MGLKPLIEANKVYGYRLIWKLLSPTPSLWAIWVHKYIFHENSLWMATNRKCSWIWQKILKLHDSATTLTRLDVHNGHSVSFWFDYWSSIGCLIDITRIIGAQNLGIPLNSIIREAAESYSRVRRHQADALDLVASTLENIIAKGFTESEDILLWRHGPDKSRPCFSSKLTWEHIINRRYLVSWCKGIWFKYSVPKFAFLAWLATKDRLTTLDRMGAMESMLIDDLCTLQ